MTNISNGQSRSRLILTLALVAGAGLTLAACQTSSGYQEAKGELPSAKPTAKPAFPTRDEPAVVTAPPPAPPAAQVAAAQTAPPPTATAPVETRPLAPPPSAAPQTVVVAQAPPPAGPVAPKPQPAMTAPASSAPPAAIPPARPNATGKVIEAQGSAGSTYTVKPSQGLDAVGREVGMSRQALIDLNGLAAPYALKPGQVLKISAGGGAKTASVYVVNAGDTLFSISKRFDSTPAEMADLSGVKPTDPVHPGQHLTLPKKFQPAKVAQASTPAPALRPAVGAGLPPAASPPPTKVAAAPPPPAPAPTPTPARPVAAASEPVRTSPPAATSSATPAAPTVIARAAPTPSPAVVAPSAPAGPPIERQTASAAQVKAAGTGKFVWPVKGRVLTSFGPKPDGQRSDGIDIAAPMNAPVRAAAAGDVIYAGDVLREYGNLVLIQHADGFVTAYGHLAKMNVKMKDKVSQDQEIGQVGDSGGVTQPQLHFETRYARTPADSPAPPVDPMLVLPEQR